MPFLREFGCWLPQRVVTSDEAASWVGTDAQWVKNVSGIDERRFAEEDESVAEMAARAGADCLKRAGMLASELAMILVASGTSERQFPGPAATTAQKLGVSGIPAGRERRPDSGDRRGEDVEDRRARAAGTGRGGAIRRRSGRVPGDAGRRADRSAGFGAGVRRELLRG